MLVGSDAGRAGRGDPRPRGDWIDQLYVDPDLTGRGIGVGLLDLAKRERPHGLRLWTYVSTDGAQGLLRTPRLQGSRAHQRQPQRGASARPFSTSGNGPSTISSHDAAKESNLPSRGLPGPASFEDWMGHQARAAPRADPRADGGRATGGGSGRRLEPQAVLERTLDARRRVRSGDTGSAPRPSRTVRPAPPRHRGEHSTQCSSASRRCVVQPAGARGHDLLAEHEVAEQPALVGQPDLGAVGELARPAEVVRRSPRSAAGPGSGAGAAGRPRRRAWPPPPCARAGRPGRRGARPRVQGARRHAARSSTIPRAIASKKRAIAAVVHLAGQVLEEPVELVEVPVGASAGTAPDPPPLREPSTGIRRIRRNSRDVDHLEHRLIAEALDPPGHADQLTALEPAGQRIRVAGTRGPAIVPLRSRNSSARYGDPVRVNSRSLREHANTPSTCCPGRRPLIKTAVESPELHAPMIYAEADAAAAMGISARRIEGSRADLRLQGLERRGRRGLERDHVRRRRARRTAVRDDRSRGVLRLPEHPPAGQAGRRARPPDRVARGRALRGAGPARDPRPRPDGRTRAVAQVAHVQQGDRRARRGARHAARGHARGAARRRPPHAPDLGHRDGDRHRPGRPPRPHPLLVRGSDRNRRRAARRLPGERPAVGEPVGGGPALHRRRAEPQGRARAGPQARGTRPGRRGRQRPRVGHRRLRPPGQPRGAERPRRAGVRRAPRAGGRASEASDEGPLPSGDTIARELQRFLRQRGDDDPDTARG